MCDHEDREAAMVVIQEGISETPGDGAIWCDPCLVPLVTALNDGGMPTVASCCGHGHRPGSVILADGSTLLVLDKAWGDLLSSFIHSQVGCQEGRGCSACVAPENAATDMDAGTICGVTYEDGVHIHADARCWPINDEERALAKPPLTACGLCGKVSCPDADLPGFSEPRECVLRPVYDELRYDRCEYGCGRDITKATVLRAARLLADLSTPSAPSGGQSDA